MQHEHYEPGGQCKENPMREAAASFFYAELLMEPWTSTNMLSLKFTVSPIRNHIETRASRLKAASEALEEKANKIEKKTNWCINR